MCEAGGAGGRQPGRRTTKSRVQGALQQRPTHHVLPWPSGVQAVLESSKRCSMRCARQQGARNVVNMHFCVAWWPAGARMSGLPSTERAHLHDPTDAHTTFKTTTTLPVCPCPWLPTEAAPSCRCERCCTCARTRAPAHCISTTRSTSQPPTLHHHLLCAPLPPPLTHTHPSPAPSPARCPLALHGRQTLCANVVALVWNVYMSFQSHKAVAAKQ